MISSKRSNQEISTKKPSSRLYPNYSLALKMPIASTFLVSSRSERGNLEINSFFFRAQHLLVVEELEEIIKLMAVMMMDKHKLLQRSATRQQQHIAT